MCINTVIIEFLVESTELSFSSCSLIYELKMPLVYQGKGAGSNKLQENQCFKMNFLCLIVLSWGGTLFFSNCTSDNTV